MPNWTLNEANPRARAYEMDRRGFLKFAALMTTTLALPKRYVQQVAEALATAVRPPVLWFQFQDCTGDTESFLRSTAPTVDAILLSLLSVEYHETLMAPSGSNAHKSMNDVIANYPGQYICIVEGSIPTAANGNYCIVGGETALSIANRVLPGALAVITVGSCAWDGGLPGAAPNPTGAVGVSQAVPGLRNLISLPGCPVNAVNLAAAITHFLTFRSWPELDRYNRPLFAYGEELHDECPRHDFYEDEKFALTWGDEGHRKGWCLLKLGCRGPKTYSNCATKRWNSNTSWPVQAGHGCIGCTSPHFWDTMSPFHAWSGGSDSEHDDDDDDGDDDDHGGHHGGDKIDN